MKQSLELAETVMIPISNWQIEDFLVLITEGTLLRSQFVHKQVFLGRFGSHMNQKHPISGENIELGTRSPEGRGPARSRKLSCWIDLTSRLAVCFDD